METEQEHSEGGAPDLTSSGRRALSFDEFKLLYQEQKRADLAQFKRTGHTDGWLEAMRNRRDRMLGPDAGADLRDPTFVNAHLARATAPPGQPPQPQPQRQPQHAPLFPRVRGACATAALWVARMLGEHWLLLLQVLITSVAMFGSWSWRNLAITCVIIVALRVGKWVVTGLQVERPGRGTNDGPTPLGRLFLRIGSGGAPVADNAPPPPLSLPCKVGYMVAKCVETFVMSLWPNYSVEVLEVQLQRDGIVRERPAPVAPPQPAPAAGDHVAPAPAQPPQQAHAAGAGAGAGAGAVPLTDFEEIE